MMQVQPSANQRAALRRQPTLGTVCRLAFGPLHKPHTALVWNISASGVSMLLDEAPETGTVLSATLATVDDRGTLPVTLRVVHVRHIRTGDYFLGAQFQQPLDANEMRPFLVEADADTRSAQVHGL
jgi:hypothetical protein